jgi:hypothetical protein
MAISRSTPTDDDGSGTVGTVWDAAYLASAVYDKIDALVGDWTAVSFSAGNFTASAGTWTVASGDVLRNRYQIINKTLFWELWIVTTDVSATPTSLRIAIPSGTFASVNQLHRVDYGSDNGTLRECGAAPGDTTHLYITRNDAGTFAASAGATAIILNGYWELA